MGLEKKLTHSKMIYLHQIKSTLKSQKVLQQQMFWCQFTASTHSFHQLNPSGSGSSYSTHVGDSSTSLKTMPLEKRSVGTTQTITLKLNALQQQTVYEYTYEYRE